MPFFIILVIVVLAYIFFANKPKKVGAVHSNWSHYFDKLQFSAQEFYSLVETIATERQMPNVKISRVQYNEASILSDKREYLRIERKEDIFDICAAPFGTGFFISYWLGEPKHSMRDLASKIPGVGAVAEGMQGSTYYQMDTASMFKLCVKDSITEAIEQITTAQGVRGLSEAELQAFNK